LDRQPVPLGTALVNIEKQKLSLYENAENYV